MSDDTPVDIREAARRKIRLAVTRLSALDPLEYERVRREEAQALGVRASVLDSQVEAARPQPAGAGGSAGGRIHLPEPDPWPEPVRGAVLLDALAAAFARHLVLPAGGAELAALWTVFAHAHDAAEVSPILLITSPVPGCGKTRLLAALSRLVPRPLPASSLTPAATFRVIEACAPTLLIDEADAFLAANEELRAVLDSGHTRTGAFVLRVVPRGDDLEAARFATWAPKAVAGIGSVPATITSRSLRISLRRKEASEQVAPLRGNAVDRLHALARQAARWAHDHLDDLRAAEPELPPQIEGRAADNWVALAAIADLAGGAWPVRAREAALALEAGRSEQTAGVMLLSDIRDLFSEYRRDRVQSQNLADDLAALEHRPWPEWRRGKPVSTHGVARLLEPFGIRPRQLRGDGWNCRGYDQRDFLDAWRRYLPSQSVTPLQPTPDAGSSDFSSVTGAADVTDRKLRKAAPDAGCNGVTDHRPDPSGGNTL